MSASRPDAAPFPPLGAHAGEEGSTAFAVWAPGATRVAVVTPDGEHRALDPHVADGVFAGRHPVAAGGEYQLRLDGQGLRPDPCSREQPAGIRGPSRVVDAAALRRAAGPRRPVALAELVIYELHVGTFTPQGTFDAAARELARVAQLGVTAIELMPVASFDGERGWGYDGLYTFAPHHAYGGPDGLARLVAAAHEHGLAVILDVVYNHLGAGAEQLTAFGPYLDRRATPWGEGLDYSRRGVREWAIQNAESWVRDYAIDGLRLDAVHAIADDTQPHVLAELAQRVKAIDPRVLVISEMEIGDERPITRWGHDAQWNDALHHAVHVLLTGERHGYYAPYGTIADLAREMTRPEGPRLVVCAQNHDQVGNRAEGDRLRGAALRLAACCAILSSGTPLLFQGEEYDESHPFLYFADHGDPQLARLTREGRRREFEGSPGFDDAHGVPDPQARETFARSKLDPASGDREHLATYRRLLELRARLRDEPPRVLEADEDRRVLRIARGGVELAMNFDERERGGVPALGAKLIEPGGRP